MSENVEIPVLPEVSVSPEMPVTSKTSVAPEVSETPEVSVSVPEASISSLLSNAVALVNSHTTPRRAALLEALELADKALGLAGGEGRADLEGRAHLVRGHCLRGMGFWSAASKCYEKASGCGCTGVVVDGRLV